MVRLLRIEWLKMKHYRTFWVLMILYYISLLIVAAGGKVFLYWMTSMGVSYQGFTPEIIPIYDFPDVWQNITYLASFIKVFLAFIVIISVTNEFSYRTLQQNVIDGLDPKEFLWSKVLFIAILSIADTAFLKIIGLVMGSIYSTVHDFHSMITYTSFLFAHMLEVFTFLMFAFTIGLLLKKAGFAIVVTGIYSLIIEPIGGLILGSDRVGLADLVKFFPIRAMNNLIHPPFAKYILREIQDYVAWDELLIVVGWAIVFILLTRFILLRRDVKG